MKNKKILTSIRQAIVFFGIIAIGWGYLAAGITGWAETKSGSETTEASAIGIGLLSLLVSWMLFLFNHNKLKTSWIITVYGIVFYGTSFVFGYVANTQSLFPLSFAEYATQINSSFSFLVLFLMIAHNVVLGQAKKK